jgi:hypothetical protein
MHVAVGVACFGTATRLGMRESYIIVVVVIIIIIV